MSKLSVIEGIGEALEVKLDSAGAKSVNEFLEICSTKKGRSELAVKTGISEKLILKWANHADLMRIDGIGAEYTELLEAAGVVTVLELAKQKPKVLYKKMVDINEAKALVRKLPSETQVVEWIKRAEALPRVFNH